MRWRATTSTRRKPRERCRRSSPRIRRNSPPLTAGGPDRKVGTVSFAGWIEMRRALQSPLVQGLLLLAPAVIVYGIFAFYPILDVVRLSFVKWNGLTPTSQFAGLSNYREI